MLTIFFAKENLLKKIMQLQKLKDAIAIHNKPLHINSPLDYNGGVVDLPELSVSPEDKPL